MVITLNLFIFSARPISLAAIMNNTELGNIVMPFLEDPYSIEDILYLEIRPKQFQDLLMNEDPMSALCGPDLFQAFAAPGNESQVLRELQTNVCAANGTVMMWQAIMGMANGYQLKQQVGKNYL